MTFDYWLVRDWSAIHHPLRITLYRASPAPESLIMESLLLYYTPAKTCRMVFPLYDPNKGYVTIVPKPPTENGIVLVAL